ncbi:MAG: PKD domain-containing protein [Bacteroidetes bacterium]|nr:PKD domain-containing protein [Bacteroidota bacterium]
MKKIIPVLLLIFFSTTIPFHSFSQVNANFTAGPVSGCSPLTVTFTDHSTGSPTSWNWNFGNTNTSSLQNPSAAYTVPGTYTVTLTVSNGTSSDVQTRTNYITVFANPVASFNLNPNPACIGNPVTFTSTSTNGSGAINHWRWTFGDGVLMDSTFSTTTHPYTFSQTFPVSLVVTDVNGCSSSDTGSVVINNGPLADFTGFPLSSCTAPLTVTFTNSSTGNPSGYFWHFGDGATSTLTAPSHTYANTGVYTVTLDAISPGCTNSKIRNNYIVIQNTVANFTGDTAICAGGTAHFTDASLPLSTIRNWNFGDGQTSGVQNPSHIYSTPGTYNVTLIATANNCTDTIVKTIHVRQNPSVSFTASDSVGCSMPFAVTFSDHTTNGGSAWLWNFGDGSTSNLQNPSHAYNANGTFSVTLTVLNSFGCSGTHTHLSYIHLSTPIAAFTSTPDSGCVPLTVSFTSTSTANQPIASYNWNFGNGTATVTTPTTTQVYPAPGIYTVSLVIVTQNGCRDSITKNNLVRTGTKPVADFSWNRDSVCYGNSVTFTDLSSAPVDAWVWTFGDGGGAVTQNPVYYYQDTGLYNVQLIVYNYGCSDTMVYINIIRVLPPYPLFTVKLNCTNPYYVEFTDASKGADSIIWDFGDGTFDTLNHHTPTHVYATRGVKVVTLIAYNYTTGCSYAYTLAFTISDPIARFHQQPVFGCYPLTVAFADSSQDALFVMWDFGDPASGGLNTSSSINPSHTYNLPGYYTVRLQIFDLYSCGDTLIKTNIIHAVGPLPGFSVNNTTGCSPLTVTFTDTSVANGAPINQYHWTFGDGTFSTSSSPVTTHVYSLPGNDTITLTVTDTNGCVKSITRPGYILPTFPFPSFSAPNYACPNQSIVFNASATATVSGSTYDWSFGDGNTFSSTNNFATHAYASGNTYIVSLTVTDPNGCDSTVHDTIHVIVPVANFNTYAVDSCGYTTVAFTDISTGQVNSWFWNLGNGGASAIQNPLITYPTPGYYTVSLTVMNAAGCRDSITLDSIVVVPGPLGSFTFTPDSGCNPLTVRFSGTSTNAIFYTWDFGDGTVVPQIQQDTISHTYTHDQVTTPIMTLGYTLSSGEVCERPGTNLSGLVRVITYMNVNIDSTYISLGEGDEVQLNSTVWDSIFGPPYSYLWSPAQYASCPTCSNTTVTTGSQATTLYFLTVTDNHGCQAYDSVLVIYVPCESQLIIPNVFTPNADGFNDTYYIGHFCPGIFHFTIYNRWGKIIYESGDSHFHWDGKTTDGQDASEGTYYYVCRTSKNELHGFLQLIRK